MDLTTPVELPDTEQQKYIFVGIITWCLKPLLERSKHSPSCVLDPKCSVLSLLEGWCHLKVGLPVHFLSNTREIKQNNQKTSKMKIKNLFNVIRNVLYPVRCNIFQSFVNTDCSNLTPTCYCWVFETFWLHMSGQGRNTFNTWINTW